MVFIMNDFDKVVEVIEKAVGYHFKNVDILVQAFTHQTYYKERNIEDKGKEILIFLGAKVIDYIGTKRFVDFARVKGIQRLELQERDIDVQGIQRLKDTFDEDDKLAAAIDKLNIMRFLRIGSKDNKTPIRNNCKEKADLFKAIFGAVAIDCGWDMDKLESLLIQHLKMEKSFRVYVDGIAKKSEMPSDLMNYISVNNAYEYLNELYKNKYCSLPAYTMPDFSISTEDGESVWICICRVDSWEISDYGKGNSRREAKNQAAYKVLLKRYGKE